MNNFLKDLMKLATELNQANGFDTVVVINEMELLYDKHIAELKNLAIHDVSNSASNQAEIVKQRLHYHFAKTDGTWYIPKDMPFMKEFLNEVIKLCDLAS